MRNRKGNVPVFLKELGLRLEELYNKTDKGLLLVTFLLVCLGMLEVASTTQISQDINGAIMFSSADVLHQFFSLVLGVLAAIFIALLDFDKTIRNMKVSAAIYILACIFLLLTLIFGVEVYGSKRWLNLGFMRVQTAEFAKITMIFFTASYMAGRQRLAGMQQNSFNVILPFVCTSAGFFLIALQPDIGIPALTFFGMCCMMYVAGIKLWDLLRILFIAIPLFLLDCVRNLGHRLGRIQAFFMSFADQKVDVLGDAYQVANSLIGICSGGLTGRGIEHSYQKTHLLTQHDTDFIFAVYAEETGLVGSLFLISLYIALIYFCYKIAIRSKDLYYRALAVGFTSLLGAQAFYSIAVNANFAPVKGITLPFISYGGSSLMSSLIIIGIMVNISVRRD